MLHTTKGIVLHQFDYSESSVIVKVYTESFGLKSYILKGAKSKRSRSKSRILQALAIVELTAYDKNKGGLQLLKEIKLDQPYTTIPFNITKTSIALFINEVLYKSLKEEVPDYSLFEFLISSFTILDMDDECTNFHLSFLMQLSRFLGFYPKLPEKSSIFFNLREGSFCSVRPHHDEFLEPQEASLFHAILGTNFDGIKGLKLTNIERRNLLRQLVFYFRLHLDGLKDINSQQVLETVLND